MKANFQRKLINAVTSAAPNLKYTAVYSKADNLKECMQDYGKRSFIYVLSVNFKDEEKVIYVGKTSTQYTRTNSHDNKYEYDKIYLFECDSIELKESEKKVIETFAPLYNKNDNPLASRYESFFNLDDKDDKSKQRKDDKDEKSKQRKDDKSKQRKEIILEKLSLLEKYNEMSLYGFELPKVLYNTILEISNKKNCTVSAMVQNIIEESFIKEIRNDLHNSNRILKDTNLITVQEYGKMYGASQEQIKQYLHKDRISGATKVGRDWVILNETSYPDDQRTITRKFV